MGIKLNLGSGPVRKEGFISVDKFFDGADQKVDLEVFPWPWEDGSVDAVYMSHYLEHVENVTKVAQEVHRILKTGGTWEVRVPHAWSMTAYQPDHRHQMTLAYVSALGFCERSWWSDYRMFETVEQRLTFLPSNFYGKFMIPIFWLFDKIANISNRTRAAWEFLHLPTDGIYWRGVKM